MQSVGKQKYFLYWSLVTPAAKGGTLVIKCTFGVFGAVPGEWLRISDFGPRIGTNFHELVAPLAQGRRFARRSEERWGDGAMGRRGDGATG
ncbi:hypothetical protein CR161_02685 [Prosthecochloris sp. ZM]|nr:hypothetical protein CR161_02685 [Prosthecochloris sp. ZM]